MILFPVTDALPLLRRPGRLPQLAIWRAGIDNATLFTTVVAMGEIERGIHRQRRTDPTFAKSLSDWARAIKRAFADRILAFEAASVLVRGRLTVGRGHESADLPTASIAVARDAAVVTRNEAGFAPTGVRLVNPFAG